MKHLSASFSKLLAVAACALTLGSCNRAEYAMLPKSSSYHGVARVAAPVPVAPAASEAAVTVAAPAVAPTPPVAAIAAVPQAAAPIAAAAVPAPTVKATGVADASDAPATVVAPVAPRKLSLVQRLAVAKVTKQLRKATDGIQLRPKQNAAETQRISGNLRTGLILLLIGLLVGLFNGLIGTIIALIGVIFIVLWLLDNL